MTPEDFGDQPIGPPVLPNDWDGDGVSDADEMASGTNPWVPSSAEDRREAMEESGMYDDATYYDEDELSTTDQIERIVYSTGLWTEGILKGAFLVLPIILIISITIGFTMGIIRVGVRGTESRLIVRRTD